MGVQFCLATATSQAIYSAGWRHSESREVTWHAQLLSMSAWWAARREPWFSFYWRLAAAFFNSPRSAVFITRMVRGWEREWLRSNKIAQLGLRNFRMDSSHDFQEGNFPRNWIDPVHNPGGFPRNSFDAAQVSSEKHAILSRLITQLRVGMLEIGWTLFDPSDIYKAKPNCMAACATTVSKDAKAFKDCWDKVTKLSSDTFHALGRFIFKREFRHYMIICGTSEYCVWLSIV